MRCTAARIALLLGAALLACSKRESAVGPPDGATLAPSAAPTPVAPSAATGAPRAARPTPAINRAEWVKILADYFDLYGYDGPLQQHNFDEVAARYAPNVAQFITLKDTTPPKIIEAAEAFFKNKRDAHYVLDKDTVSVAPEGDGVVADATVAMSWVLPEEQAPWPTDYGPSHLVNVDIELVFDAERRITKYLERHVHERRFRVVKAKSKEVPEQQLPVPYGAIVDDLHDYVQTVGARGNDVLRRVRYQGKPFWVPEVMYMEGAMDPAGPAAYVTVELRYLQPLGGDSP